MQRDAIFVVQEGSLTRLEGSEYESEEMLQRLIADFPDLLPGAQINSTSPRRWALIAREVGVPGSEGGSSRWSLDHLFVDQDGIPTVVEVKRSTDTRIRREVVGQMLDYAANGVRYWPIEDLREAFEATHGHETVRVIEQLAGDDADLDEFWERVEDNLRSGRIRMLFVADDIPAELQTIIEYLNEQMTAAEVFGVEIKQFSGEGLQTLVPRVIGLTAAVQHKRRAASSATHEELMATASEATREVANRISALAEANECHVTKTKTALKVSDDAGAGLALVYPQWNRVEFFLSSLWDRGLTQEASELHAAFSQLQGSELTERHPYLTTDAVLEQWDTFTNDLFPRYVRARRRAREP